jgi:hypothetical protein
MGNQRCKPGLSLQPFSFLIEHVQTTAASDGGKKLQEYCVRVFFEKV